MELVIERYSSLEDRDALKYVLENLSKNPLIEKIIFKKEKITTYSKSEVAILREYLETISTIKISLEKSISSCKCKKSFDTSVSLISPSKFYNLLKNEIRKPSCSCKSYKNTLISSLSLLSKTKLFSSLLNFEKVSDEKIFSTVLKSYHKSLFSSTLFFYGFNGKVVDDYYLGDGSKVSIIEKDSIYSYVLNPIELNLNDYEILLINELIENIEKNASLLLSNNPRKVVSELVRKDLIKKIKPSQKIRSELIPSIVEIVIRNTIGYGVMETMLMDDNIQDIYLNKDDEFIYITHSKYEEMITNVLPSKQDVEEWATKIRLENDKPLDESHPILDGNIYNKRSLVRVSLIHPPLSTKGISFSIRRHREIPITIPYLVKEGTLSSKAAAYLSIISLFGRSMLIAGSRGSGKTTLLGALMFELPPKYRMVVVEDTLELPIETLRKNNYNVVSMKSKSFLSISEYDVEAQDALRASLRFGDSCLIIGEARGKEVVALYEAMRVGALSNFVAGTLHAESPYGVYDRVVNDLGVKKTSFKATDVMVLLSLVKEPSSLKRNRKLISITEVKDDWGEDPLKEKAFLSTTQLKKEKYNYYFSKSLILEKIADTLPEGFDKRFLLKLIDEKERQINEIVKLSKEEEKYLHPNFVIKANLHFLSSLSKTSRKNNWRKVLNELGGF